MAGRVQKYLSGFAAKAAAPERSVATEVAARSAGYGGAGPGAGFYHGGSWDVEKAFREGMQRVVWVFRCIDIIASAQSRLPIVVRQGDRFTGTPVEKHPLYDVMNVTSNVMESGSAFRYRVSAQLLLSTKGVFVEVLRKNNGEVLALTLLPSQWTTPVPDPILGVSKYVVKAPQMDAVEYRPDQVLWFRKPHPIDPYGAITPMEAAGLAIDMDWLARLYNRNFLLNDGRPGGLVVVKGDMDESDKEELRSRFRGNIAQAGRVGVISSEDGADFVDMATNPRDAQYRDMRGMTQEEILLAFGVPKSQMGDASGRTFDNADAEDLVFWEKTMFGHNDLVARPIEALDPDPTTFVDFDYSRVPVLAVAEAHRGAYVIAQVAGGLITQNEGRAKIGHDPVPTGGDFLWVSNLWEPVGSTKAGDLLPALDLTPPEPAQVEKPPPLALPAGEPEKAAPFQIIQHFFGENPNPQVKVEGSAEAPSPFRMTKEAREAWETKALDGWARWELVMTRSLKRFFGRQARVVGEKLGGAKRASLHAKGVKTDAGDIFDQGKWDDELDEDLEPIVTSIQQEFGDEIAAIAGTEFDAGTSAAALESRVAQMARLRKVNQTTYDSIAKTLAEGSAAGETIDDLVARVAAVFDVADGSRAESIARTEVVSASNEGLLAAASETSLTLQKTWVATEDDRTRADHAEADGQSVGLAETFDVGGEAMQFPGDPDASAEQVINCRCVMFFEDTKTGEEYAADEAGEAA